MSYHVDERGALTWPTSADNPRNGEADAIELSPGRLFLAYTYFYGGGGDESAAEIRGMFSSDGGRIWGDEHVVQENTGECNVMCANLLRLQDGRVALVYNVKNGQEQGELDARPYIKFSDDCVSWTDPHPICTDVGRYYCLENSRLVQLSTGRIMVPLSLLIGVDPWWLVGCCAYSDDGGAGWSLSEFAAARDYAEGGFDENGVVEIDRTRREFPGAGEEPVLLMYARTSGGQILHSISINAGITWSRPHPLGPVSPQSPALMKRIPSTGDLLLMWNAVDRRQAVPEWRSPLTAAISKDEGQTWINMRDIESDISTTYCYPSATFTHDENVVITYYQGERIAGRQHNLRMMKLRVLPVDWFY